jgi:hypothetical protein
MEGKKSFLLYCDTIFTVNKLTDQQAGQLFKLILSYVNDENPDESKYDLSIQLVFEPIKQSLKRDLKKWENICDRNRKNGSKGGRPKNPDNPMGNLGTQKNPDNPNKPDSDIDSDIDSVKDIKYIYNSFYDNQITESNNDPLYLSLVKIIFGENEDKKKLDNILKFPEQLTFEQFQSCIKIAKENDKKISDTLLKINNDKKYYKGKISLNRTLKNWLNQRFV